MGLPSYFHSTTLRTLLAESGNTAEEPVRELAKRVHLDLVVGTGPDAERASVIFVELAARTFGSLAVRADPSTLRQLRDRAHNINPAISESARVDSRIVTVGLETAAAADIRMWGRGWWCGYTDPGRAPPEAASVGALAAGVLAFNHAFLSAFEEILPKRPTPPIVRGWSFRNWVAGPAQAEDLAPLPPAFLPSTAVVGCGAIGQASAFALSHTRIRGGPIELIDPQTISTTNLQRYIGSRPRDATDHSHKVVLAAQTLAQAGVPVVQHAGRDWASFRTTRRASPELVVTALDSASARRLVQAALPRWIVNGWTRTSDCGATLHEFAGDDQCLACTYLPRDAAAPLNDFAQLSTELGLEPIRVVQLIDGGSLQASDLRVVERERGLPADSLRRWRGESVRSLYGELCGVLNVRIDARADYVVPLPQASALAGILLVAQVIKLVSGLPISTRPLDVSLLSGPGPFWELPPARKDQTAVRCICKDQVYLQAYRRAWLGAP